VTAGREDTGDTGRWLALLVLAGAGVRLWQAAANPSLWLDELALARNIAYLPLADLLTGPLLYDQIAPPGFLAAARLLHELAPDADWPFRVVPLLASLLAIPLTFAVARRVVGEAPALGAAALVALSPPLAGLGWVAKQYALDGFVTAALLLGAARLTDENRRDRGALLAYGALGGLLLFFSYPGVLVGAAAFVALSATRLGRDGAGGAARLLPVALPLALCAAAVTLLALRARPPGTAEHMQTFWAMGFPDSLAGMPRWLLRQARSVVGATVLTPYPRSGGSGRLALGLIGLAALGLVRLAAAWRRGGLVVAAPGVAAVVAAAAGLYPLHGRVSLFLAPVLAVLVAGGLDLVGSVLRAPRLRMAGAAACAAVALLALLREPPPYGTEHTRPLLREVSRERRPGDRVYSYYAANQAVDWYGSRFGLGAWDAGTCRRGDGRAYLAELDRYRGEPRVWVLLTHVTPIYDEGALILAYLRTIGREVDHLDAWTDGAMTSAYLFDLSDPDRLERTAAAAFGVPEVTLDPRYGCGRGPHSLWRRPGREAAAGAPGGPGSGLASEEVDEAGAPER
jgi:hypothetical protein